MGKKLDSMGVPKEVIAAFHEKFPGITPSEWEMEAQYEADFSVNGKEVEVTFDAEGNIVQIEYEIDVEELPEAVINAIEEAYPYCEIIEAERVENEDGDVLYEVDLGFEAHISPEGKILALGSDL